jgi:hypothetical protein
MVMETEEGRELRARASAHKEAAAAAWDDGGSSRAAFARFFSDVESRQPRVSIGEGDVIRECVA